MDRTLWLPGPQEFHIKKPGDSASVSSHLFLTHTGNSQGSFIGDCHSYEETQARRYAGMPSVLPKLPWHHALTLGPQPFLAPVPPKALQMTKNPNPFPHHSKLPLIPPPTLLAHPPAFKSISIPSYISPTPSYSSLSPGTSWVPPSSSSHLSPYASSQAYSSNSRSNRASLGDLS